MKKRHARRFVLPLLLVTLFCTGAYQLPRFPEPPTTYVTSTYAHLLACPWHWIWDIFRGSRPRSTTLIVSAGAEG